MFDKKRIKKYFLYYFSLLFFFILCLKTLGGGYKHLTGSSDPLSWQEIAVVLPKYMVATAFLMVFLIYIDYMDYKQHKK